MVKKQKTKEIGAPKWDLSDLYTGPDDLKIERDLAKCANEAEIFESRNKGQVKYLSEAAMLAALIDLEVICEIIQRVSTYAGLLTASDTANETFKTLENKIETRATEIRNHLLFFEFELLEMPDDDFGRLLVSPKLSGYAHFFENLRKQKPFHLSLPEERILNEKRQTSFSALCNLFTNFVARAEFKVKICGRVRKLREPEVLHLLHSSNRETRKAAADAFTAGPSGHGWLFTDLINALAQDKAIEDKLRRHSYPEEARHLANEISQEAVDVLVGVCVADYGAAEKYYALKRKVLSLPELFDYDKYAPLEESSRIITYKEGQEIVMSAYHGFSEALAFLVREFYDKRWIDAEVRNGKVGGGFCASPSPNLHPYILTNFQGSLRDVMIDAHELGHGVHGMLARNQSFLNYYTPLTTAETASVFGEMLVFESLKNKAVSDREKLFLIMQKLEDIIATVFRQIAMFRFEQKIHHTFRESGRISEDKLNQWWNEEHQAVFGESLALRREHGCWWMYVPHIFHTPFYVYAYAFGELLTLSLYAKYKAGESDFEERYVRLLSAGGSKSPDELLADFGVNVADENFWKGGLSVFESMLQEAEELVKKTG